MTSPKQRPLKVVIVGAGLAGLTLANVLDRAPSNIEYTILESRDELAPQLGAGIALGPAGSRILDQLGLYDELRLLLVPVASIGLIDEKGKPLVKNRMNGTLLSEVRLGYPFGLIERRALLLILLQHVKDRTRILTNRQVVQIKHSRHQNDPVTVTCANGEKYLADVVVGADGIRSKVRSEMWNAVENGVCGNCDVQRERQAMKAEYRCLYGISRAMAGFPPGHLDETWGHDVSTSMFSTKGGRLFWFLYEKLPRVYDSHEVPRFNADDALEFFERYSNLPLSSDGSITTRDLWQRREVAFVLPLEEADFQLWTAGRLVCMGDCAHKMVPHTGAGGMCAIEDAAVLGNQLNQLAGHISPSGLSTTQVETILTPFDARQRHARVSGKISNAAFTAHLAALKTKAHRFAAKYLLPFLGDAKMDQFCDENIGADLIQYLPIPSRSTKGTMAFNPSRGIGSDESKLQRMIIGLPLLLIAILGGVTMFSAVQTKVVMDIINSGVYKAGKAGNFHEFRLPERFFHITILDEFARKGVFRFAMTHLNRYKQCFAMFADFGIWYTIMLIESARRGNNLSVMRFSLLWGLLGSQCFDIFMALYQFLHYIFSPISVFDALDRRLTDLSYTKSILPVTLLTHYATYMVAYLAPQERVRVTASYLWELLFLWTSLAQYVMARFFIKDTVQQDKLENPGRDLPWIRSIVYTICAISTAIWQYNLVLNWHSFMDTFLPKLTVLYNGPHSISMEDSMDELFKWDGIFMALGNLVWIALLYGDLKRARYIDWSWFSLTCIAIGVTVVGGNGTMTGLFWLYREEVLAKPKHRYPTSASAHGPTQSKE